MIKPIRLLCLIYCVILTEHQTLSSSDEIDPFDMINFDQASMKMKNKQAKTNEVPVSSDKQESVSTEKDSEEKIDVPPESVKSAKHPPPKLDISKCPIRPSAASPLFRQFVNSILYHLKDKVYVGGTREYDMRLILSYLDVENLRKYGDSETEVDLHTAHAILTKMVFNIRESSLDGKSSRHLWIEDQIGISVEKLVYIAVLVLLVLCTTALLIYLNFSLKQMCLFLFIFIFISSVMLTWYSLYKREVSKQHLAMSKDMPDHCKHRKDQDSGFIAVTFSLIASPFTFHKDECLEYFEHLLIDPLVKVSPMEAVAVTLTRFFITPLRHIAEELSKSLRVFLKDLPVQLWPIALVGIALFIFLLLFMGFGYRLKLPFGMIAIEPGRGAERNELHALEERHRKELGETKDLIMDQQKIIQEMLVVHLERNQSRPALPDILAGGDAAPSRQISTIQSAIPFIKGMKSKLVGQKNTKLKHPRDGNKSVNGDIDEDSNSTAKQNEPNVTVPKETIGNVTVPKETIGNVLDMEGESTDNGVNNLIENGFNDTPLAVQCTDDELRASMEGNVAKPSAIPVKKSSSESSVKVTDNVSNIGPLH